MYTFVVESLVGQCEYTTQPKGSFWCHVIDTKGAVLSMIFTKEFVFMVLCLSFSFRYAVEFKAALEHQELRYVDWNMSNFTT